MGFLFGGVNTSTRAELINTFQSTLCEFSSPLTIAYGLCKLSPNLINYLDFTSQEIATTTKTGKNSSSTSYNYKYYVYCELALCEGAIGGLGKVWVGTNVYSSLAALNGTSNEGRGLSLNVGNNSNPTSYMQSRHPSIAVGYRNMAYLYGTIYLGTDSASMPSYSFETYGFLRNTGDGVDANPADVIIDLLTRIGLGSKIDTASFNNFRSFCANADLLISTPADAFTKQSKCQEVIKTILSICNAYMFWSVDRFKIVPRETHSWGSWHPNNQIIYDLTDNDFIADRDGVTIKYQRKDSSEHFNRFGVKFTNRANNYETETVFFEDTDSIRAIGLNASSVLEAGWLHTKARAIRVAEMQARINKYENIKYTFKLSWNYGRLESGDLVTLTDDAIGLNKQVVMIESVTEDANGRLTITALSREAGNYTSALYSISDNYNVVDFNIEPSNTANPIFITPPKELITSPSGLEVWIALHGKESNWGGCNVYVSDKDSEYSLHGEQAKSSLYGNIITAMTTSSDTVDIKLSNPNTVEMASGSAFDAEMGNTLVYVDDEFMSYSRAVLIGANTFRLTGLKRGLYGSKAIAHAVGSSAVNCDSNLYTIQIPKQYLNRALYFKFPAFNIFKANHQSTNSLTYYTYDVTGKPTLPDDVIFLDTELLADGVRRFWWKYEYPSTNDIAGFKIKYIQGTYPQWSNAYELHTGLITSQPFETNALRQGTHTVMIKAIDTLGQESANATYTVLNIGDLLEENVLYKADISEDNWSNTYNNGLIDANNHLKSKSITAFWSKNDGLFWSYPSDAIWESIYSNFDMIYQIKAMASGQMWLDYDIDGPAQIQYLLCGKDSYWMNNKSDEFWSKKNGLFWGVRDNLYKAYTGKVLVKAGETIQIGVFADANLSEPTIIKSMKMIIDVPDKEEHFENVTISASGTQLDIKTPNYYTTAVRIDAVQSTNTNVFRAIVIQKNPCVIKLVDVDYEPLSAVVDVTWQGFIKEVI